MYLKLYIYKWTWNHILILNYNFCMSNPFCAVRIGLERFISCIWPPKSTDFVRRLIMKNAKGLFTFIITGAFVGE